MFRMFLSAEEIMQADKDVREYRQQERERRQQERCRLLQIYCPADRIDELSMVPLTDEKWPSTMVLAHKHVIDHYANRDMPPGMRDRVLALLKRKCWHRNQRGQTLLMKGWPDDKRHCLCCGAWFPLTEEQLGEEREMESVMYHLKWTTRYT